jgi:hypothetical protein
METDRGIAPEIRNEIIGTIRPRRAGHRTYYGAYLLGYRGSPCFMVCTPDISLVEILETIPGKSKLPVTDN